MSPAGPVPQRVVRDGVMHVVVTGSECTGKSTLARQLAGQYGIEHVPEFVRDFARTVGGRLQFSDHGPIARGQIALEDEYSARDSDLVIHDTDLMSTVVYCRHYFGHCPAWIEAAAADRRRDLYLGCDIDVPWIADGVRDRGERRDEMHALFVTALNESGARWELMRGDEASRLRRAKTLVDGLRH
jgi:Predicted ATPase/kinase involved in NAD metabolism